MADPIPFSFTCDARWDDMLGSGSKRLCTQCDTPVVDLSSMTEAEAQKVLATPGVCVNYIVRDGQVVYGRKARGGVDPEGAEVRASSRRRGRGRRLLRWASAAASVAAVGGVVAPGVAEAGSASSEESSALQQLRSWVASWFEPEELRLGGEPMPVDDPPEAVDTGVVTEPEPPRRLGGKPVRRVEGPPATVTVDVGPLQLASVELRCGSHRQRATIDGTGLVRFSAPTGLAPTCTVTLRTDPPRSRSFRFSGDVHCSVDGLALSCE